jgi:murein DD-endopeptidase MepM/ murein hydrolase activator NlpD
VGAEPIRLNAGPYVFPVYGSAVIRTSAAGADVFGELGQPVLACADGSLFSVGWTRRAGDRLWLRDEEGNTFSYAHLSAFSTLVAPGRRVHAGQVLGFLGRTGRVDSSRARVHFEIHPVSLLFLGGEGVVDPLAYFRRWSRVESLPLAIAAGWSPDVPGTAKAPEPGATLFAISDISTADGLEPGSLGRVLRP